MSEQDDWISRLRADNPDRENAIAELRQILVRGLSRALGKRGGGEAFVEDVVQEALLKILDSLSSFAGRSRFVTWAMAIGTRVGISELRKRHFQDVSLEQLTGGEDLRVEVAVDPGQTPSQQSDRDAILMKLRQLISEELTEKQRLVMQAALEGLPVEEIGRRLGSNRNAVYKMLHDARQKLRAGFEQADITAQDVSTVLP